MVALSKAIFDRAAKNINRVLGDSFTYTRVSSGDETPNMMITINRNKKVNDEFGNLIGYRVEASILKADLTERPTPRDTFINADGSKWRVGEVTIENASKWYIDVQEV